MTIYSSINYVSNPLHFSTAQISSQRNRSIYTQMRHAESILSNKEGSPDYADTMDAGAYIQTELNLKTLPKLQTISQNFQDRFSMMKRQVEDAKQIASEAKSAIMQLTVTDKGVMNYEVFISQIKSCLGSLTNVLNRTDGLSTMMAGVGEDEKAVKNLQDLPYLENTNEIDYSYYIGETGQMSLNIKGTEIEKFPITAKDEMFAKIVHASRMCFLYNPGEGNREVINQAQDILDDAISDYLGTIQKIDTQLGSVNQLLNQIPADVIEEEKKRDTINNQDQMMALLDQMNLTSSLQINQHLQTQRAMMAKRFAETLGA